MPKKKDDGPDALKTMGLDGVKRLVVRWGFQGKGLMAVTRIEAPSPRKGVLGLLEPKPFRKDMLPPIPRAARSFAVAAFEPGKGYDKLIQLCKAIEPGAAGEIERFERVVKETTGKRLREDLLGHLGPNWAVVNLPAPTTRKPDQTLPAVLASVDDPAAFLAVLDALADRLNALYREPGDPAPVPVLALERLPAPARGYKLTSPAKLVTWLDVFEPTLQVGRSFVAIAPSADLARAALDAEANPEARWAPAGEVAAALRTLPAELTFLAVGDPRNSPWPDAIANLPAAVQFLGNTLSSVKIDDMEEPTPTNLLAAVGIPLPGAFRVRLDPAHVPEPDALRPFLFPSVLAAAADPRGFRLLAREALPLACLPIDIKMTTSLKRKGSGRLKVESKFSIGLSH